jgi:hypothetical protein
VDSKSKKKISSNSPRRDSSGGKLAISLAVATTKQEAVFSFIQVKTTLIKSHPDFFKLR